MKKIKKANLDRTYQIKVEGGTVGVDIVSNITTEKEYYRFVFAKDDGRISDPVRVSRNELNKVTMLRNLGNDWDGSVTDALRVSVEEKYKEIPVKYEYSEGYGWQCYEIEGTGEIGQVYFNGSSIVGLYKEYPLADNEYHLKKAGNLQNCIDICNNVMNDKTYTQIILASSLASVIAGALNLKTVIINIEGKTSQGKTTIMMLCASFWSNKEDKNISTSWYNTDNALVSMLNGNEGVLFIIDDTSKGERKDYTSIVYDIENGTSKGRLNRMFEVDNQVSWHTIVLSSSETSLYAKCDETKKGLLRRLVEISVYPGDLIDNVETADEINRVIDKNYGHIGMEFVNYLFKEGLHNNEFEGLRELYNEEKRKLQDRVGADGIYKGIAEKLATIMLAAKVAKNSMDLQFDIEEMEDAMIEIIKINAEKFKDSIGDRISVEDAYEELCKYARENCRAYEQPDKYNIPVHNFNEQAAAMKYANPKELKIELMKIGAVKFGVGGCGFDSQGRPEWDNTMNVKKVENEVKPYKKVISIYKNVTFEGAKLA
ncbi:DUF927 domain-containing protein [Ruminiclostridium josui]|uniref:DUF927 domain-containing protein n=2 Tax=Ruminiclostridium josui TaxID=1499 RepID=UPI00046772F3|nr:DUF927 domain-containing protein [Ruminiclostridium josui]